MPDLASTGQTTTPDPAPAAVMEAPALGADYYDDDNQPHGIAVGWDLSWGCKMSIGFDADQPEQLHVTVSMSDEDHRRGLTVRSTTREQVRAYAEHLLDLVGREDAVAALDGDAAATPQPAAAPEAGVSTVEARQLTDDADWEAIAEWSGGELRSTRDISDEYNSAIVWPDGTAATENDVIVVVRATLAAASSAPPVDVTARVRAAAHAAFTAMDKGVLMSETGDGAESVLAVGHLRLIAEYLERHPDWPSAQAIVRALAGEATS